MGLYDTLGFVQLKTGLCEMKEYNVGDKVSLNDGIYIGYGGAVVVLRGVFVAEFPHLKTKYGETIETDTIIEKYNPVAQAIKTIHRQLAKERADE